MERFTTFWVAEKWCPFGGHTCALSVARGQEGTHSGRAAQTHQIRVTLCELTAPGGSVHSTLSTFGGCNAISLEI